MTAILKHDIGRIHGSFNHAIPACQRTCCRLSFLTLRQRLLSDVSIKMQTAFMSVLEVIQMPLNRELNVAACDDLTAQDGVAVVADAGGMVSG